MANSSRGKLMMAVWLFCHTAFLLYGQPVLGQVNLVPNGFFEILDTCPYKPGQLYYAAPWFDLAYQNSEAFNVCDNGGYSGVPKSVVGYQWPNSGQGYAGFNLGVFTNGVTRQYSEYMAIKLSEPLKHGASYCFETYLSLANVSTFCAKEFHIKVSKDTLTYNVLPDNYISATPTAILYIPSPTDTLSWQRVSAEFIADGDEEYLSIGFFRRINPGDTIRVQLPIDYDFYYVLIDDVSLYYCGPDTIPKPEEPNALPLPIIPNVFTPNGDGFNDVFRFDKSEGWNLQTCIRNRWGQVVFEGTNAQWWDGITNGQQAATGVYFYTVTASNQFGQNETFHGTVSLLR